jgi:hypothetical protein
MTTWNGWDDTGQRLFIPFGGNVDNSNAPWWDLGGMAQRGMDQADQAERQRKQLLYDQARVSSGFADQAQGGYQDYGRQAQPVLDQLRRQANGQDSVSAEQLRQGLQQNVAAQRSLAAGAAPRNTAMAARTAAIQSGRLGAGMAGQQAIAGIQERQSANQSYGNLLGNLRGQDLQAALGGRQNAMSGYAAQNAGQPEKSGIEKFGPAAIGALGAIFSDRRLKTDVRDGGEQADAMLSALRRASTYRYKDEKNGEGEHLGPMAQDLERAGSRAVVDTPRGKMVNGARLASENTAMLAALRDRVAKLEGKGR